jgi:phosphoribosylformylglycinamidine (FGAM) synthase PurS component
MKHFTLLENENSDFPMIGTIQNIINTKVGFSIFKESFEKALNEHFDISEGNLHYDSNKLKEIFENLFQNAVAENISIKIVDIRFSIKITETWIY